MSSDDAKKTILARRARFIAAAMASAGATASCDSCHPFACLEPAIVRDGGAPPPLMCLSTAPIAIPDAGATIDDASIGPPAPPSDAGVRPVPCLSQVAPRLDAGVDASPKPCLTK